MRKLLIVLAAFAFVVAYTVPAMADDEWDFYGSARILTFSTDKSKETTTWGTTDDDDLTHDFSGSSRVVGAKVKAGDIGGRLELGGTVNLRLAYGTWNFGAGTLVVGHAYSPANFFPSGMVYADNSMVSYGAPYAGRHPQVKLQIIGLQVALVQPKVVSASGLTPTDTDTSMPKIELSYSLKAGPVALYFFGGMNSHDDVVITGTTEKSYSIDSSVLGVGFRIPIGALYINGNVWVAQNPANYGMLQDVKAATGAAYNAGNDSIEDCDSTVMALVLGYKISDMIKLEGGYGVRTNEVGPSPNTEAETTFMYIQAPISLAKGVTLTPEFGSFDYGDVKPGTGERGDLTYWGLRWKIDF
jgi:hypothetical protein